MKKLHVAALISLMAMAATSAFASNEMYVLGGVAYDTLLLHYLKANIECFGPSLVRPGAS